jgi:H+-transporting ATPase
MPDNAVDEKDDVADEEIGDVVKDLPKERQGARPKSNSTGVFKITGTSKYADPVPASKTVPQDADDPEKPRRQKAMSDVALLFADPTRVEKSRTRQKSAADIIRKMNDPAILMDGADLKLGEIVEHEGTASFRSGDEMDLDIPEEREHEKLGDDFILNHDGLTSDEAAELFKLYGPNSLPEKSTPKWQVFLKLLIAPMPLMIWAAAIIEAGIENWIDMAILLFIQFANASIGFYETTKAADAVASLKDSLKPLATVKRDGKWQILNATLLVPGDTVLLGSGSAIPADCRVNEGEIDVDQAALTGESLPVTFFKKDSCKMGSTVVRGEVDGTVEFTGSNTFLGKTAALLETSYEFSYLQKLLMRVVTILVVMTVTLCTIQFIYLLVNKETFKDALSTTIVILIASIPLAIEIVTTTTLSIGSKKLVAEGAIVAQLSAIERLAGMSILCSDKTGTLTLNQMVLQDDTPMYVSGETQATMLMYAALAAKWKEPPRDALDRLTLGNVDMTLLEPYEQLEFMPFDPTIKRTEGTIKDTRTGKQFKATKGAPHILLRLLPHNDATMKIREEVEKDVARLGAVGTRALAVGRTNIETNEWEMLGLLTFLDPPRPDTKQTIDEAREYGVAVKMITGDHLLIARNTSNVLGLGKRVFGSSKLPMLDPVTKKKPDNLGKDYGDLCLAADGFSEVFPEHKFLIVECLRELGYTVGMTGDGVNDAPALKRADVGIAVAGATDAARAAADIVLTQPGLHTIIHGIILSREIFARINSFITYRVAATLQLLWFLFIATFIFKPKEYQPDAIYLDTRRNGITGQYEKENWDDFFHMPVLMLMLITLLNDGTLITIGYDNAKASERPCKWNLLATFLTSGALGIVGMASSLILLSIMLNNWKQGSLWDRLGLKKISYGQLIAAVYLQLSVCAFLTLFSARSGGFYFWQVRPSKVLFGGQCNFAIGLCSRIIDSVETNRLVC